MDEKLATRGDERNYGGEEWEVVMARRTAREDDFKWATGDNAWRR